MHSIEFQPLVELENDRDLAHGTLLRLAGSIPHEAVLDLMVVESYDPEHGMGLMVTTGHKAGLLLVVLPVESGTSSISVRWLKENWAYWCYPKCAVEDVYVSSGYPVPDKLPL